MLKLEVNQKIRFNGRSCIVVAIDTYLNVAFVQTMVGDDEYAIDLTTGKFATYEKIYKF